MLPDQNCPKPNQTRLASVYMGLRYGTSQEWIQRMYVCRPSFGSVLDWFQNGPVETEGLSGPIFGPDPFGTDRAV